MLLILSLAIVGLMPMRANAVDADSHAGIVATSSGPLNVRRSASTSAGVVAKLTKGSYVTLVGKSGNWWHVEYEKGQYGYCHGDYIDVPNSSVAIVATKTGPLNVRNGAGTNYHKIGSVAKGEIILVLSNKGSWSRILYHGTKTGYVSNQYISAMVPEIPPVTEPEIPTEAPEDEGIYKSISLDVPYYLQNDSRWSSVKLGSSGKSIGKIGCTTTAIAMLESYRRGTEVYPDAMAKELRYTSSGSLYWPPDYIIDSGSLKLQAIYDCLLAGKPVIIGCNTSNGGQHWAVVYGYTGAENLNSQEFLILDPGTRTRTTLAHLIRDYPIFRRMVYYR